MFKELFKLLIKLMMLCIIYINIEYIGRFIIILIVAYIVYKTNKKITM